MSNLMLNSETTSRFNEIYDSTNRGVLAFIVAKCGRTADVGDIFQETYAELYGVLVKRGVGYVTDEKALVMRIAKRMVARHYSLAARLRMFVSMRAKNEDGEDVDLSDFDERAMLESEFAERHAVMDAARRFIRSRPEVTRKIFYLRYDLDLPIAEIERLLGLSESNVKNRLYRTLKELREVVK
jgi:RNA polymerase sigma-70 factor (ECF subfamily)